LSVFDQVESDAKAAGEVLEFDEIEIEISNIDLIQLMEDKKNIDSITAEGFQLVYKVESDNSVIFKEVE